MPRLVMVIVTLAIAVTGCDTSDPEVVPTPSVRQGFLVSVRAGAPAQSGVTDATDDVLWARANTACDELREDPARTPAQISESLDGEWPGAGARIVASALAYACPEFVGRAGD